jgi:diacylglycerol O-acyltransferase / wax synthase
VSPDPHELNRQAWDSVGAWSRSSRMNDTEAVMWRAERHPSLSSTIMAIELLDTVPDWRRLHDAHEWGSRLVKRFRQRVVDPFPHVQAPHFEEDPQFDLDDHLRRVTIGPDAGMEEVLGVAETIAMTPLDRNKPLWEAVLIEGLENGRSAYLLKSHHSISDGIAGIQLFGGIHSRTREPSPEKPTPEDAADSGGGGSRNPLSRAAGAARSVAGVAPAAARAVRHPRTTVGEGLRMTGSLRRVLDADIGPPSPLLRPRTGESWRFEVLDCALDDLKAAARAAGVKLNDAYVAALLGGLHRFHERSGVQIETLPVAMPVSVRDPEDELGGNRFTAIQVKAPIGVRDPRERMAIIHGSVLAARAEPALNMTGILAPAMSRLPSELVVAARSRVGAGADLSASNFPGISWEAYVAGAKVERIYPFGPLPGSALMATLVSHNGVCCIGLNCDGTVITEPSVLRECIQEGLDEVLAIRKGPRSGPQREANVATD